MRSARTDLIGVRALVTAVGGLPAVFGTATVTDPTPEPTPSPTPSPEPSASATPSPEVVPLTGDPALDALVAALRPGLAVRLLADGIVTQEEMAGLEARAANWRRLVRRLRRRENALQSRVAERRQIAGWNRRGAWRPLIKIAAKRYHISAGGLYRLMMCESGGRRYAGRTYKGLFQYYPGTWRASWNPWRSLSIYNGWAQIQATALAIRRGMGPGHWPNTYPIAF